MRGVGRAVEMGHEVSRNRPGVEVDSELSEGGQGEC